MHHNVWHGDIQRETNVTEQNKFITIIVFETCRK